MFYRSSDHVDGRRNGEVCHWRDIVCPARESMWDVEISGRASKGSSARRSHVVFTHIQLSDRTCQQLLFAKMHPMLKGRYSLHLWTKNQDGEWQKDDSAEARTQDRLCVRQK
jgi:hypothetical protein